MNNLHDNHQSFLKLLNELPQSFIDNINEIDAIQFEGPTIDEYLSNFHGNYSLVDSGNYIQK